MNVTSSRPRRYSSDSSQWKAKTKGGHKHIKVNSQQHGIYNTSQQVLRLGYKKTPLFKFKKANSIRNPYRLERSQLNGEVIDPDNILDKIMKDYDAIRLFYLSVYDELEAKYINVPQVQDISTTDHLSESALLTSLGFKMKDESLYGKIPTNDYHFAFHLRPDAFNYSNKLPVTQSSLIKTENSSGYAESPLTGISSPIYVNDKAIPSDSDHDFNNFLDCVFSESFKAMTPTEKSSCNCMCHLNHTRY